MFQHVHCVLDGTHLVRLRDDLTTSVKRSRTERSDRSSPTRLSLSRELQSGVEDARGTYGFEGVQVRRHRALDLLLGASPVVRVRLQLVRPFVEAPLGEPPQSLERSQPS